MRNTAQKTSSIVFLALWTCASTASAQEAGTCTDDDFSGCCPPNSNVVVDYAKTEQCTEDDGDGLLKSYFNPDVSTGICVGGSDICNIVCEFVEPCLCGVQERVGDNVVCNPCELAPCGDGICGNGETASSCPSDCVGVCNNGDVRCNGAVVQECVDLQLDISGWQDSPCPDGFVCRDHPIQGPVCLKCDPENLSPWFYDGDGDGFGDPQSSWQGGCFPPSAGNWARNASDCDDSDPLFTLFCPIDHCPFPGATRCTGVNDGREICVPGGTWTSTTGCEVGSSCRQVTSHIGFCVPDTNSDCGPCTEECDFAFETCDGEGGITPTNLCGDDSNCGGCGIECHSLFEQCVLGSCEPLFCVLECGGGTMCDTDDGCGGTCECGAGDQCQNGQCCTPTCDGVSCGADDGCGSVCGCDGEDVCNAGNCECVPECDGSHCDDDGCGGTCECAQNDVCGAMLTCDACQPSCDGTTCADDGCGGTCTCDAGEACDAGICECVPECDGTHCDDDGCGGACECDQGDVCGAMLTCDACVPSCDGTTCGDDGCGGTCECPNNGQCGIGGQCSQGCTPSCTGLTCGADGCGGLCQCQDPMICDFFSGSCR